MESFGDSQTLLAGGNLVVGLQSNVDSERGSKEGGVRFAAFSSAFSEPSSLPQAESSLSHFGSPLHDGTESRRSSALQLPQPPLKKGTLASMLLEAWNGALLRELYAIRRGCPSFP